MKVTIIGLGLIGGSIAKDLRRLKFADEIIGVDNNKVHRSKAVELGIVDYCEKIETAVKQSDIVVLAVPVDKIMLLLPEILDNIGFSTTVIDVGSTKKMICTCVENHPKRGNYVAAHPMAGTEFSGPEAAVACLFEKQITIICEAHKSKSQHLALAEKMLHTLGMQIAYMSADTHDYTIAHVSHLPHVTAFSLANMVLENSSRNIIFELRGGGFHSAVRLAKSSPEMWAPIFDQNRKYILEAVSKYIQHLEQFKKSIEDTNADELICLMKNANQIGGILEGNTHDLIKEIETNIKLFEKIDI